MLSIYRDANTRVPMGYKGLTFNQYIGTDPTNPHGIEVNSMLISTVIGSTEEAYPDKDGMETYGARKAMKLIRLQGRIVAPSYGQLNDLSNSFARSFDPARGTYLDPTNHGFDWLTGSLVEGSPAVETGYQYWCRAQRTPEILQSQFMEFSAPYTLQLVCSDPSRYTQALTTTTLTGAGVATVSGDYPTWPEFTITMAGAGSSGFTITNSHYNPARTLVFDLSTRSAGQVLTVIPREKKILVNGADTPSLFVSGNWDQRIGVVSANLTLTNNASTTVSVSYRKAYSQ